VPSESKRSYSKSINSYQYWVSQIAKTRAASNKKSTESRERKPKPAAEPASEEVVVTNGPRKPEVLEPLNLAAKINAPKKTKPPPQGQTPPTPSQPSLVQSATTTPASPISRSELAANLAAAKDRFGELLDHGVHGGPWTHVGNEPSSSDPEHPHTISVNSQGELGCDCPGYIKRSPPGGRTCKHCQEFASENN